MSGWRILLLGAAVLLACSSDDETKPVVGAGAAGPGGGGGSGAAAGAGGTSTSTGGSTGAGGVTVLFPPPVSLTDRQALSVRGISGGYDEVSVSGVAATSSDGFLNWLASDVPLAAGDQSLSVDVIDGGNTSTGAATVQVERNGLITRPTRLALDSANNLAYLSRPIPSTLFEVDLGSGARRVVSGGPLNDMVGSGPAFYGGTTSLIGLAPSGAGIVYAIDQDALFAVDTTTGNRTIIADSNTGTGNWPSTGAFDLVYDGASNRVLTSHRSGDRIVAIDLATGNRTTISDANTGTGPAFQNPNGLLLDSANSRVLVVDVDSSCPPCSVTAVDLGSGDRTVLSSENVGTGPALSSAFTLTGDLANNRLYAASWQTVIEIDALTGNRTEVGYSGNGPPSMLLQQIVYDAGRVLGADYQLGGVLGIDVTTTDRSVVAAGTNGAGEHLRLAHFATYDTVGDRVLVYDQARTAMVAVDPDSGDRTTVSSDDLGSGLSFASVQDITTDGSVAFVAGWDGTPAVQRVDLGSGDRVIVSSDNVGTGPGFGRIPRAVEYDPGSQQLWVLVEDSQNQVATVFSVDPMSGDRTVLADPVTGTGALMESGRDLIFDSGRLLMVQFQAIVEINTSTGDRTTLSADGVGSGPNLWIAINTGCGASTLDGAGNLLVLADPNSVVAVDLSTGDRSAVSAYGTPNGPIDWMTGLAGDGSGRLWVADSSLGLLAVDPVGGERVVLSK